MHAILLIAGNYLREQRWLLLVLLAWVFGSSIVLGLDANPVADAEFFLQQQAIYGVAFGTFLAASAIQNERRSRRILSVLSKGIERRQYLAGLLFGVGALEAIYMLAMAVGSLWMLRYDLAVVGGVAWLLLVSFLCAMLSAAIALFFSTFLNPLFALVATAITAGIPAVAALAFGGGEIAFVPVYSLVTYVLNFSLVATNSPSFVLLALGAVQAIVFWIAAVWVFEWRDVATAIE